jgi:hypothetical protein
METGDFFWPVSGPVISASAEAQMARATMASTFRHAKARWCAQ